MDAGSSGRMDVIVPSREKCRDERVKVKWLPSTVGEKERNPT